MSAPEGRHLLMPDDSEIGRPHKEGGFKYSALGLSARSPVDDGRNGQAAPTKECPIAPRFGEADSEYLPGALRWPPRTPSASFLHALPCALPAALRWSLPCPRPPSWPNYNPETSPAVEHQSHVWPMVALTFPKWKGRVPRPQSPPEHDCEHRSRVASSRMPVSMTTARLCARSRIGFWNRRRPSWQ